MHGRKGAGCARRHDDICLETDQLGRLAGEPIIMTLRPAVVDGDALSLDIAELAEALAECLNQMGFQRRCPGNLS